MKKKIILGAAMLCLVAAAIGWAEGERNLGHLFKGQEMKVFVEPISNKSVNTKVPVVDFKKELEASFTERRSVLFKIVEDPNAAELKISCTIKEYIYSEKGPLKPTPSIGTTALDMMATMDGNYAHMLAHFIVSDAKDGKALWEDDVYDYSKKKMAEDESYPIIFDKVARRFVARAFGKPKQ